MERRIPWTVSRVVGSPDPPLPYTVERCFTNLAVKSPIYLAAEPGTNSLLLIQSVDGTSHILRFDNDPDVSEAATLLEMSDRLVYGLTFHDKYSDNGFIYIFSNGPTSNKDRKNRISCFHIAREAPFTLD